MFFSFNGTGSGNKHRAAALILACALLLLSLLSVFFIAHEADHDCTGEDCPVCALIQQCENNLRQIGSGTGAAVIATGIVLFLCAVQVLISAAAFRPTLISLKTRLNN